MHIYKKKLDFLHKKYIFAGKLKNLKKCIGH